MISTALFFNYLFITHLLILHLNNIQIYKTAKIIPNLLKEKKRRKILAKVKRNADSEEIC